MPEKKDLVKQWYDGFCFGAHRDVYNPWSITNYLKEKKTAALLGSYKFQWIDQQTPAVGIGKYEGRTGKTDQQTTNCS